MTYSSDLANSVEVTFMPRLNCLGNNCCEHLFWLCYLLVKKSCLWCISAADIRVEETLALLMLAMHKQDIANKHEKNCPITC